MDENIREIVESQRRHRRIAALHAVHDAPRRHGFHVREVIRHGDFRHDAVTELPDLDDEHLRGLLADSPYRYGAASPVPGDVLTRLRTALLLHQPAFHGWSEFSLVSAS